MNCPYFAKYCSKCNKLLIAHTINFGKASRYKYGVKSECKVCEKERHAKWYIENKETISIQRKEYRENNIEKVKAQKKKYREANKEIINAKERERHQRNKEQINERHRKNYWNNIERERIRSKEKYKKNKKIIAEKVKQDRLDNPEKYFNRAAKRRKKENTQGSGINKEQWKEMMEYFDWKCAYSNEQLTNDNRTIDHIISLNKNGEHEVWNTAPMIRSYNCSKQDKDMEEWYKQQEYFSEERLQKIYKWQAYAYEKWAPRDKEDN